MAFEGRVVVEELAAGGGTRWRLTEPLTYVGREERFVVDAGFTTDFASVPQVFTWLIPRYGRYTKAAILHDYLWGECRQHRFRWADADGILRRVMRELDVPFLRRWLMWTAVRLASITRYDPRSFLTQGPAAALSLVAFTLGGVTFLAVPAVVVGLFQLLFAGFEAVVWLLLAAGRKLRKPREPKQLNRPRLALPR
jgi:Protein of unknown function (DUF1353)